MRTSKFMKFAISKHKGEDSPKGDFVDDMIFDVTFPTRSNKRLILNHLNSYNACEGCIKAFLSIYDEYEKEK